MKPELLRRIVGGVAVLLGLGWIGAQAIAAYATWAFLGILLPIAAAVGFYKLATIGMPGGRGLRRAKRGCG